MLDGLEREGIVVRERDPGDRRSVAIKLTPPGLRILRSEGRRLEAKRDALMAQLEPEEREQAARLLTRLAELMEEL
jgi:DNA-binding MarR family transcriptional regulator